MIRLAFVASLALGCCLAHASGSGTPNRHGTMAEFFTLVEYACNEGRSTDAGQTFGRALPMGMPVDVDRLLKLSEAMREGGVGGIDDDGVPAGIAFLGQFIDHDITLDVLTQLGQVAVPEEIANFRTPELDLDSVYGDGPETNPYLYDIDRLGYLLLPRDRVDLPRNPQGVALIGDPRNDENGIISQLHLLFVRFHNAVLHEIERGVYEDHREAAEDDFEFARRIVQWHYQWIVLNEFLPAVVHADTINEVQEHLRGGGKFCSAPVMPVEFSAAAYRFGHSQIRSQYKLGPGRPQLDLFAPPSNALSSFSPVSPLDAVNWDFFFGVDGSTPQAARRTDPLLARELFELPFAGGREQNLAFRNLLRGSNTFQLPTGEDARDALRDAGFTVPTLQIHSAVRAAGLPETPLWFYCLQEADEAGDGKLTGVGGTLVAVTLMRLLSDNGQFSYLKSEQVSEIRSAGKRSSNEPWAPFLGEGDTFTVADMVDFVRQVERR